jgi:hypothetical protein
MKSNFNSKKVAGIDPGLASGGFVVVKGGDRSVIKAYSLVEKKKEREQAKKMAVDLSKQAGTWGDNEFTTAVFRAESWMKKFDQAFNEFTSEHGIIDYFAIESFVDQRSRAREEKQQLLRNRWHTPLLMGLLVAYLNERDYNPQNHNLFYQNAGIIIRQWSTEIGMLAARKKSKNAADVVVKNDYLITNDHQRKALVHAFALSLRLRDKLRKDIDVNNH